ncbi:choice-of-anchor M domain-containing protein [Actinocorallia longicatena]|uniref:Bacterial Ig-like domain-containing protein n=1 Tax=Actinocorallia longicatena TaxID=111803 RepID=A0ABP6Q9T5_9ACTN
MKRLLAGLAVGALGLWSAPALADAPPAPVARTNVIKTGHADVLAGRLTGTGADTKLAVKTSHGTPPVDADPAGLIFKVGQDHTLTQAEATTGWDFLGAANTKIWIAPSNASATTLSPLLGWSFADLTADKLQGDVTVKMSAVTGPGRLEIFTVTDIPASGTGGTLNRLLSSDPSMDQTKFTTYKAAPAEHKDVNWAFTKEGVYQATFDVSATLKNATTTPVELKADPVKVTFVVGAPATTTALTATPIATATEPKAGDEVTLVATVTPNTATGYAEFFDGTASLGNAELVNGIATFKTKALTAGTKSLTAKYSPKYTDDYTASTSTALSYAVKAGGTTSPTPTPTTTSPTTTSSPVTCTVISDGHYDYAAKIEGTALHSKIKDAAGNLKEPGSVAVRVTPTISIPSGQSFLGSAGTTVWQLPQTQSTGTPFLGWSTEGITKPVTWTVDKVTGPGKLVVFTTGTGTSTTPAVVFNGRGSTTLPAGTHAHGTWAFTKEGVYRVKFTQKSTLENGTAVSDTDSLIFMVGNAGDTPVCDPGSGNLALTGGGPLLLFASIGTMFFSAGAVFLFFTRRRLGLF